MGVLEWEGKVGDLAVTDAFFELPFFSEGELRSWRLFLPFAMLRLGLFRLDGAVCCFVGVAEIGRVFCEV